MFWSLNNRKIRKIILLLVLTLTIFGHHTEGETMNSSDMIEKDKEKRREIALNFNRYWEAGKLNKNQEAFLNRNNIDIKSVRVLNSMETNIVRTNWDTIYLSKTPKETPKGFTLHQYDQCYNPDILGIHCYGFNWHIFSFGFAKHKKVKRDFLKTLKIHEQNLILMWEECNFLAVELSTDIVKKINFTYDEDLYVFPPDCSWTFISTHENEPFSPSEAFYSRRDWLKNVN